jgi:hypothetical protein
LWLPLIVFCIYFLQANTEGVPVLANGNSTNAPHVSVDAKRINELTADVTATVQAVADMQFMFEEVNALARQSHTVSKFNPLTTKLTRMM